MPTKETHSVEVVDLNEPQGADYITHSAAEASYTFT